MAFAPPALALLFALSLLVVEELVKLVLRARGRRSVQGTAG